ncbi:MAG TPA: Bro-N domain-containing protein [Ktedonobacterales bacterium]|nr:Bro-N domain-containing protein [Ktedonobacterales bacterium]
MTTDDRDLTLLDEQAEARVRRVWHEGRWFFSVIDVVGLLTDAPKPRQYWFDMKRRIQDEGFVEVSAFCRQLKMQSPDGKQRLTDAADTETMLRIIQSIPSPKAEPFKQWLARVGAQRLEELENPRVAADSLRLMYHKKGYADEWIEQRLQGIVVRDELTTEWHERGAEEGREFAILTEILHRGTFDVSTDEHRQVKSLKQRDNLRDNMTTLELALTMLSEATSTTLHQTRDSQGLMELQRDALRAGEIAGNARQQIESETGRPVVSPENAKSLTARAAQPGLFGPDGAPDPSGG